MGTFCRSSLADFTMSTQASKKIAVVSGSHKGLGFEIARQLAEKANMHVVVTARKREDAERAKQQLTAMGFTGDAHELDVTDDENVNQFSDWLIKTLGRVDVLVNNAGVNPYYSAEEASVLTARADVLLETINTNAAGMLRITQAMIPFMKQQHYGRVVNVSTEMACLSLMGQDAYPISPAYRASKVVMNAIAILFARELSNQNILINSYSPGWMKTDIGGPDAPFTVEEGAETALYLATLPDDGPSGQFFAEMRKFGGPFLLPW